jgi:hypothetical protein
MTLKLAVVLLALALVASLAARGRGKAKPPPRAVETARKCPSCGAWVAPGARCGCDPS